MTRPASPILLSVVLLWAALLAASAVLVDARVAQWVHESTPLDRRSWLSWTLSQPGVFWFTAGVAFIACLARRCWQAGAFVLLAGVFSGMNWLAKWVVGRLRPYKPAEAGLDPYHLHPFKDGLQGLFTQQDLAFPSGHTSLAFATAAALWLLFPRWRALFVLLALTVAAQRVLVNAHYVSDTIGGAAVGVIAAALAWRVCRRDLEPQQAEFPAVSQAEGQGGAIRCAQPGR